MEIKEEQNDRNNTRAHDDNANVGSAAPYLDNITINPNEK